MALVSLARETEKFSEPKSQPAGGVIKTLTWIFCSQPMILLCFYHNMTFDTKVSHLVHILGGRSSKLLFLSVLSCQLLGLVRLLGLRSGTKLSTGGGSVVGVHLWSASSPIIFGGSSVEQSEPPGPRNVWHSFDVTSPSIILLQSLQRNSFRRRNRRVSFVRLQRSAHHWAET